jgi:hypothetical protein
MEWNRNGIASGIMEWNGMEWNRERHNGMEWNGNGIASGIMEWNGMGMEWEWNRNGNGIGMGMESRAVASRNGIASGSVAGMAE